MIDDRSTDDSKTWISSLGQGVEWVNNSGAQGFAGSVNSGLKWAINEHQADYIAIANNDIMLLPDTFKRLKEHLQIQDERATFGLLGFLEFNPPFTIETLKSNVPTMGLGEITFAKGIPGCFFIVSKEAVERVGFFDESYFMYGEDNDYFHRILACGLDLAQSGFPLWHRGEGSSSGSRHSSWLAYRNALRFSIKNQSPALTLRTFLSLLNQGINPTLKRHRSDPSYLRISRHSVFTNLGFLLASVAWNLFHVSQTLRSGRSTSRGTR